MLCRRLLLSHKLPGSPGPGVSPAGRLRAGPGWAQPPCWPSGGLPAPGPGQDGCRGQSFRVFPVGALTRFSVRTCVLHVGMSWAGLCPLRPEAGLLGTCRPTPPRALYFHCMWRRPLSPTSRSSSLLFLVLLTSPLVL